MKSTPSVHNSEWTRLAQNRMVFAASDGWDWIYNIYVCMCVY